MQLHEYVSLSDITYYHIGGETRYVAEVTSEKDVIQALRLIRQKKIEKIYCMGLGSNVIFPDDGFEGAIILFKSGMQQLRLIDDSRIEVFSGVTMDQLIQFAFANQLVGLGWAGGLPSSVGGAVRGNAGAFGSETQVSVEKVQYIDRADPAFSLQTATHDECHFGYRNSMFKLHPDYIITSVTFGLKKGTEEELTKEKETYHKNIAYRQRHHPMEHPSCGSIFKNIVKPEEVKKIWAVWPDLQELSEKKWYGKVAMAYIIGRLGFAGYRVGGAALSPKHNNYISNIDHAKSSDVRMIIEAIKKKFFETFGFEPELEVAIVG